MCTWVIYCGFVLLLHPDHPPWIIVLSCESSLSWPSATSDLCLSFNICKLVIVPKSQIVFENPQTSLDPFWSYNPVIVNCWFWKLAGSFCVFENLYTGTAKPVFSYPLLESSLQLLEGSWVDFCPFWLLCGLSLEISTWGLNYVVKLLHTLVLSLI